MKQALAEDEEYSKETMEGTRLEAVENIAKYQEQTRKWRDSKVIRKTIQDEDLVLRRRPNGRKYREALAKTGRPLHGEGHRKTQLIPLHRRRRQSNNPYLEHLLPP
jgi:histone H3/H4